MWGIYQKKIERKKANKKYLGFILYSLLLSIGKGQKGACLIRKKFFIPLYSLCPVVKSEREARVIWVPPGKYSLFAHPIVQYSQPKVTESHLFLLQEA